MVATNQPSDELVRELYARFGLAYYHSEVLHRGLCIILAMSALPRRDLITRPRVEEKLAQTFSLTLGEVVRELEESPRSTPPNLSGLSGRGTSSRTISGLNGRI